MSKLSYQILLIVLLGLMALGQANAVGTQAGTPIVNNVTVTFNVGGVPGTAFDSDTLIVQEIIDVNLISQNAANVPVTPGATNQALIFLLTNTGNGTETFAISLDNTPVVVDDFDPSNGRIFFDSNGNNLFDGVAIETLYVPGANDPQLLPDANQTVFVVSDIPISALNNEIGTSELSVNSTTPGAAGAAVGTNLDGLGDAGIDAVVGITQAIDTAQASYVANGTSVDVAIVKAQQVVNDGASCTTPPCAPITGATIRYTLAVTVSGTGIANNLVITDPIPTNTSYVNGSITLDGVVQTDTNADGDAGSFSANSIAVDLGNTPGPVTRSITFDVIIN